MQILKRIGLILKKANGFIKLGLILSVAWTIFASSIYLTNYLFLRLSNQYFMEKNFVEFVFFPIIFEWLIISIIYWMSHRNILEKITDKIKKNRILVESSTIIFITYLFLSPYICSALNLNSDILTIPTIILLALLNKTLWTFIFLFWFGWNLISVLRSLANKNLEISKCNCKKD